jgi:hypothetical protein
MVRGSSLLLREATAIRIDLAQLGFPYHMTYAGLGLDPKPSLNLHISTFTRVLQNVNRSSATKSTVHHLPAPLLVDSQDGYMLLSPSPYSQCVVVVSHNRIAKVLDLPEYVASTSKVSTTHKPATNGPQSTQVEQAWPGKPVYSTYHDNQFHPISY